MRRGTSGRSVSLLPRGELLGASEVEVAEPLLAAGISTAILVPVDRESRPEDSGGYEGANVHPHSIIEVGIPADRLRRQRLPADVDVVGRLDLEPQCELTWEFDR